MLPIDSVSGKYWDQETANRKLHMIEREAIEQLHARDIARGLPENGQRYQVVMPDPESDPQGLRSGKAQFVPELMSIVKSTGGELVALIKHRWALWCLESRDQAGFLKETEPIHRAKVLAATENPKLRGPRDELITIAQLEESLKEAQVNRPKPVETLRNEPAKNRTPKMGVVMGS